MFDSDNFYDEDEIAALLEYLDLTNNIENITAQYFTNIVNGQ